jgi:hypothetical protein
MEIFAVATLHNLLDKCKELLIRRESTSKELYKNFVAPIFADFEAVHRNYIDSFERYRDLIETSDHPLNEKHPVIAAIAKDSLFSDNLRSKIDSLEPVTSESTMVTFVEAVLYYVNCASHLSTILQLPLNAEGLIRVSGGRDGYLYCAPRAFLSKKLKDTLRSDAKRETKKSQLLDDLHNFVKFMQMNYRSVGQAHRALQKKLLQPK